MKLTLKEKLLARVRQDPKGCWLWTGYLSGGGYGMMYFAGRQRGAHRASWIIFRGRIPAGKVVCHKCDVPACVNPDHLFLGSHADNAADKVKKGRCPRGERVRVSKLTATSVIEIRSLLAEDRLYMTEIARLYNVSPPLISAIKRGKIWRHVQAEDPAAPASAASTPATPSS